MPTFLCVFSLFPAVSYSAEKTHYSNEAGNVDQLSLKYNTITTDYAAMASTWFTESWITTLAVCVQVRWVLSFGLPPAHSGAARVRVEDEVKG